VTEETLQETGLIIKNIKLLCVVNLRKYAPKHYIDLGFTADWESGEPRVMEPDKAESWDWYYPDEIPFPRFGAVNQYLEAVRTGVNFFDL
jgi:8-oxo-dGTP diphosphatase